ncbi:MAG TPA: hypothetical protein VEO19_01445 [Terriglobia bacterium]|nr:hypothetical protein [Terriglobia bacterium]
MTRPKLPATAVAPALIHENYLRACKAGLVMREADFRRRYHTLKHGLGRGASSLEESMAALGEDPAEFDSLRRLIERAFVPKNLPEYEVVLRLAGSIWRRLRLYKAAARWEEDSLRQALSSGPDVESLSVEETRLRAYGIMMLLLDEPRVVRSRFQLLAEVERQIRALLKIRSGGKAKFHFISRQSRKAERELEEEERFWRAMDRIDEGGPEVEAILEKFRPQKERR